MGIISIEQILHPVIFNYFLFFGKLLPDSTGEDNFIFERERERADSIFDYFRGSFAVCTLATQQHQAGVSVPADVSKPVPKGRVHLIIICFLMD